MIKINSIKYTDNDLKRAKKILYYFNKYYNDMQNGRSTDSPKLFVMLGNKLLHTHEVYPVISAFNYLRKDLLTSDRELAAFAMAYQKTF